MAALGARVRDELVGFVQGLGAFEGLRRGKAKAAVGVALEVVEVVERGRPVSFDFLLNFADSADLVGAELAMQALGFLLLVDAGLAVFAVLGGKALC